MKTKLPEAITTVDEAKKFLKELHSNGEHFHCEDNAEDCFEQDTSEDTAWCKQATKLMGDIYNLPGNESHLSMAFDPCGYILDIDAQKDIADGLYGFVQTLTRELKQAKGDMESVFQLCLFSTVGGDRNSDDQYAQLSKCVPASVMRRQRLNLQDLEAILYGQAGLLPAIPVDGYSADLLYRYVNFRYKYAFDAPMNEEVWRFEIPENDYPTICIAHIAAILHKNEQLYSKCMTMSRDELKAMFSVDASEYWEEHERFGIYAEKSVRSIDQIVIEELVKMVMSLRYFVGQFRDDEEMKNAAVLELFNIRNEEMAKEDADYESSK